MGGLGVAGGVLVLPKRSDSGIQNGVRTTSLWLECPLESLSRKNLLHFLKTPHFPMKNTRSYSLNETHILHGCPELSRASCEIQTSPKLFPASWRIHRCQKLSRASWEDSESIQTDLMDLSLNRNELAMAILRSTVEPTVRRSDVWTRDCTSCIAIQVFVRTERLRIG